MSALVDRLRELVFRLRTSGRRDALRRDLDEEMQLHRQLLARDLEREGMSGPAAARRVFGSSLAIRERSEAGWGWPWIEDLIADLRYGARQLRRSPMFAAIAIGAIGIAIGINAGFFTLVDSMMFRPMPVAHPERFVRISATLARGGANILLSYPDYQSIAARSHTLDDVVAYTSVPLSIRPSPNDRPISAIAHVVSGNFLSALGGSSGAGRVLTPADERDGAVPVIVLSHRFWTAKFGGDRDVVGRVVSIGGVPVTVAGAISEQFVGPVPLIPDLWMTIATADRLGLTPGTIADSANTFLSVRGHLRAGATIAQAQAELSTILARPKTGGDALQELNRISGAEVKSNRSLVPFEGQTAILAAPALVVVGLVLVIACANLANLLMARALARQREISLRLSIGASRNRLIRQLLTESLLIAVLGAAIGLLLSHWTVTIVARAFFGNVPTSIGTVALRITESWRVVAYTIGLCGASVIIFGLAPALQATAADLSRALKGEDALFGTGIRRSRFRDALLALQVAGCVVLLLASATLVKDLKDLAAGNSGLGVRDVLVATMGLTPSFHTTPALAAERAEFARQTAAVAGVTTTARVLRVPFTAWFPPARIATDEAPETLRGIEYNRVTPSYFGVVGQRVLDGRGFTANDSIAESRVAVVTAAAARRLWPGRSMIGQILHVTGNDFGATANYSVVGIVADAHSGIPLDDDSGGYLYLPATGDDFATKEMPLLVRTDGRNAAVARAIDGVGRRLDPDEPLTVLPAEAQYDVQLTPIRYGAIITAVVGVFGLALAVLGLYGIVAFSVTQRRRDVAVHIAMGADSGAVLRLVLQRELRLVVAGLLVGAVLGLAQGQLMKTVLIGISPIRPAGFIEIELLLFAVSAVAALIPARRALAISPMQVLRQE